MTDFAHYVTFCHVVNMLDEALPAPATAGLLVLVTNYCFNRQKKTNKQMTMKTVGLPLPKVFEVMSHPRLSVDSTFSGICLCVSVCLFVRAIKTKRLELSTPKLADIHCVSKKRTPF